LLATDCGRSIISPSFPVRIIDTPIVLSQRSYSLTLAAYGGSRTHSKNRPR